MDPVAGGQRIGQPLECEHRSPFAEHDAVCTLIEWEAVNGGQSMKLAKQRHVCWSRREYAADIDYVLVGVAEQVDPEIHRVQRRRTRRVEKNGSDLGSEESADECVVARIQSDGLGVNAAELGEAPETIRERDAHRFRLIEGVHHPPETFEHQRFVVLSYSIGRRAEQANCALRGPLVSPLADALRQRIGEELLSSGELGEFLRGEWRTRIVLDLSREPGQQGVGFVGNDGVSHDEIGEVWRFRAWLDDAADALQNVLPVVVRVARPWHHAAHPDNGDGASRLLSDYFGRRDDRRHG